MGNTFTRLSALHFDEVPDLYEADDVIDGVSARPLIAYDLMLPMIHAHNDETADAEPLLLTRDRARGAWRASA